MTSITIPVFCSTCWNGHEVVEDCAQLLPDENRVETECPYCGEPLMVVYELRAHVVSVKSADTEFPRTWAVEARAW